MASWRIKSQSSSRQPKLFAAVCYVIKLTFFPCLHPFLLKSYLLSNLRPQACSFTFYLRTSTTPRTIITRYYIVIHARRSLYTQSLPNLGLLVVLKFLTNCVDGGTRGRPTSNMNPMQTILAGPTDLHANTRPSYTVLVPRNQLSLSTSRHEKIDKSRSTSIANHPGANILCRSGYWHDSSDQTSPKSWPA